MDTSPSQTEKFLGLISHAADRATAMVTDDPHHALARVAAGLASQVAGQSPSGRVEFGRKPNLINEAKSIPAGATDINSAATNVLGALADKVGGSPMSVPGMLSHLRDSLNAYTAKNGDPAPAWSRDAEAKADQMHQAVNSAMGLSPAHGFTENLAESTGNMLGQLPLPGAEAKTAQGAVRGGLKALLHAVPEYLGPTIRPSLRNYATGALGGGTLGALASAGGDQSTPPPPVANNSYGPKEQFQ